MSDYIARCDIVFDNTTVDDIDEVTENEVELAKAVNLMRKTGFVDVTLRYGGSFQYVIPKGKTRYEFNGKKNGVLTIIDEDTTKTVYRGVRVLKVGDAKRDGENPMKSLITWGATDKL
jgi:hypothetical protein